MSMRTYILVTPCKDEEYSLPKLADSVINQKVKPELWVIVDDGSTDKTPQILQELTMSHDWIKSVRLDETPRDLGIHVAHVYRVGFDHALEYCINNNIAYDHVGVADSDVVLDDNYFEYLMNELEMNPKLGICSGRIGSTVNGKILWDRDREDLPTGGARLWNKKCFEETGGYLLTCSPDSIAIVKAKLRGWETKKFDGVKMISLRPFASAEGQWIGYKKMGANNYHIGFTPLHILLKGVKLLWSKDDFHKNGVGIPYMRGYFTEYFKRAPRIDDKEVIDYYRNTRLKEILCLKTIHRKTR